MNYLTFEHISKSYGNNILFRDISLHINKGQKVALIARNGSGKTSLLRILAGEEEAEGVHRRIEIHPDVRIGYLKQEPHFDDNQSIIEAAFETDNEQVDAVIFYEKAMATGDNDQIQKAIIEMDTRKAWDTEARVKEILDKLDIAMLDQKVGTLSGGQKKRLALARILIDEPDFIIMDEPTNHLDLEMIEWLEEYLQQPNLTLLLITHDRYFMERICDTIIELDNLELYKYSGNYADYLEKKTARKANEAVRLEKNKKLLKTELEWVRRQPKARGTKAKARVQNFEHLREELAGRQAAAEMEIAVKPARLGSKIVELQYISKSYDDKVLIDNFHYLFKKRDRVGVIGPNGTGKSTLLDIIIGAVPPDSGKVVTGETIQFGYYSQHGLSFEKDIRVIDVIRDIAEYIPLEGGSKMTAAALLERFMFSRSQQQAYVSTLSGGEKRRLNLLTVLMKNPNFLILDEPTNDLDIFTLNVLEDYLVDFSGCLVIVSHDRFFMDKLVDHLFVFEGNGAIRDFPGNYSQYRIQAAEELSIEREARAAAKEKEDNRKSDSNGKALKNRLKKLERNMEALESRKSEIQRAMVEQMDDNDRVIELSKELKEVEAALSETEAEWMELVDEI